jgi:hypothetical protein
MPCRLSFAPNKQISENDQMPETILPSAFCSLPLGRRDFLYGLGSSLGALALTDLQAAEKNTASPLAPKKPMRDARAKAVIMLFMEGGPSQADTFDPKPELSRLHLSESTRTAGLAGGKRFYVGSPFKSRKVGNAGIDMSDQWKFLADPEVADELCVYRGCKAESLNHPEALLHMNTGSRLGGDPGLGAWTTYGLGSENQNLPGYVVMTELALPQAGPANWTNGFLPAHYQGTRLRSTGSPILDLNPPKYKSREHQRKALDQLAMLNANHAEQHPEHAELKARMESYELAYRMQMSVPGIIDIDSEPEHTQKAYGLDRKETSAFGRQCLMARRLVEEGVRFVQIFSGGWDSHDYLEKGHSSRINSVDQPIAALIKDLKARGMLEDTLVVWTGEFGRTPDNNYHGSWSRTQRGRHEYVVRWRRNETRHHRWSHRRDRCGSRRSRAPDPRRPHHNAALAWPGR